jgi:hypothetical protein
MYLALLLTDAQRLVLEAPLPESLSFDRLERRY